MIRLLRLGGVGGATAGLGVWLNGRGRRFRRHRPRPPCARISRFRPDWRCPKWWSRRATTPRYLARRAIEELGGIRRFISRGDVVVVKPNAAWDRTPEQAANTNPQVVAEVCRLCLEAGARRVR